MVFVFCFFCPRQFDYDRRFGDGLAGVFRRLGRRQLGGLGERRQQQREREPRGRLRRARGGGRLRRRRDGRKVWRRIVRVRTAVHRGAQRPDHQMAVELPEGEHATAAAASGRAAHAVVRVNDPGAGLAGPAIIIQTSITARPPARAIAVSRARRRDVVTTTHLHRRQT